MYTTLVSLLIGLAAASPVALQARAGGPIPKPIPARCSIHNPLNKLNPHKTYQLPANFVNTHQVYSYYLPMNEAGGHPESTELKQCEEQCYGFGNKGDCKSVYLAYNVPLPVDFPWGEAGSPSFGCQFFDIPIGANEFIPAKKGHFRSAAAANIKCPH